MSAPGCSLPRCCSWTGSAPAGLASNLLDLILLEEKATLPWEPLIELAVAATVLPSMLAHGITAAPALGPYARKVEAMDAGAP